VVVIGLLEAVSGFKAAWSFVELALAQNPNGSAMPVGVLTAYAWKTSKQEFLEAGRYKRIEIKQLT